MFDVNPFIPSIVTFKLDGLLTVTKRGDLYKLIRQSTGLQSIETNFIKDLSDDPIGTRALMSIQAMSDRLFQETKTWLS